MIVVTGASGRLGGATVGALLQRLPASEVAVSARDPRKAQAVADRGVRVRRGDYDDPASLREAFEGAEQVLVVSASTHGEEAQHQHRAAIEAAVAVGAGRVLYTSHMGARADSAFAPMVDHAATEELLAASGTAYTSLRNGFYTATVPMLLGPALQTGTLAAPEDGPVSWTTHADLARAAAIALTEDGALDGVTPGLTGSEALDLADVAAVLSELAGREVTRVTVADEEYVAGLVGHGVPADQAAFLLTMFHASRRGEFAAVDPTLERLLGRAPRTVREVLAATVG